MNVHKLLVTGFLLTSILAAGGCSGGGGASNEQSLASNTQVSVTNLVGQAQTAATNAITAAGLTVGGSTPQSSATVPSGTVISQSPQSGTSVISGSIVFLTVSAGPAIGGGVALPVLTALPV